MVALRKAYEKIRTPERTIRRGREPGVPISLYRELDGITERVDALTTLIGGTRDTLSAILSPETGSGGAGPVGAKGKPFVVQRETVMVPLSGTAGAAHSSEWVIVPKKFRVISALIAVETTTTARPFIEYRDSSGATIQMLLQTAFPAAFKMSSNVGVSCPSDTFIGNIFFGLGQPQTLKTWDAGAIRFRIASASPNSRIHGTLAIDALNEV